MYIQTSKMVKQLCSIGSGANTVIIMPIKQPDWPLQRAAEALKQFTDGGRLLSENGCITESKSATLVAVQITH